MIANSSSAVRANVWRLAGVRWVHSSQWKAPASQAQSPQEEWLEVPNPLPRVRLVTQSVVSASVARDLRGIDPARTVLLEAPVGLELKNVGNPVIPGQARIVSEQPGQIEIATNAPTRQLLVLSESWHPGWTTKQDGDASREVLRAYGDYQACLVEPGSHTVLFRFAPKSFEVGKRVTLFGLLLAAGMCPVILLWPKQHSSSILRLPKNL
ncbi:MAG: hypothetical protein H7Z41_12925 [Cytophagales bacterium]|nr:hypothetical protein [Armatimonadota bacterium]